MNNKNKNYIIYVLVGIPFILLATFLYLTFTTNKSLGVVKID